jgi:cobyrinic acid a,c-diamide synthase
MEYCIVKENAVGQFTDEVNRLLKEGWKPQGGVAVIWDEAYTYYYQAMIRDAETK